jgi:toxin ParE1/3/4
MPRVLRRPQAGADIAEVWDFIADDSLEQADLWLDRLDEKLKTLAGQPRIGRSRSQLAPGLRSLPFGRYVIFYLPIEDGIDLVRLLHSARDVDAAFDEGSAGE